MVSRRRYFEQGFVYHVLNRGAQRQHLFFSDGDYMAFESLMQESHRLYPLPILTYELMPNHWHEVVQPNDKAELTSYFQYLTGTHGKRFRAGQRTIGEGHVYQDRFKSFPVQSDEHFLSLWRYVERNALRAGLVTRAEEWKWSALYRRIHGTDDWLNSSWPVPRPEDWIERVNEPLTFGEMEAIRRCIRRGSPFGTEAWVRRTAKRLGLQHVLRPAGRPRIARAR